VRPEAGKWPPGKHENQLPPPINKRIPPQSIIRKHFMKTSSEIKTPAQRLLKADKFVAIIEAENTAAEGQLQSH